MQRAFYNLTQSMLNHQRSLDAISNNLTNINTAGYKKDEIRMNAFQEELILVSNRRKTSGKFVQTYVDTSKSNLEQSSFEFTESPFDIGIQETCISIYRVPTEMYIRQGAVSLSLTEKAIYALTTADVYSVKTVRYISETMISLLTTRAIF